MPNRFPFIVIEALDAGGSQTQTDHLVRRLKREKRPVLSCHFPQEDKPTGRLIYDKYLFGKDKLKLSRREQALLYIQDFFAGGEEIDAFAKRSKRGVVVSDRYYTSTMAYQTVGLSGQARRNMLQWIEELTIKGNPALYVPDIVVFIDTPVDVIMDRLAHKKRDVHETRQKLTAFRSSYVKLAAEQKWTVISGVTETGVQRTRQDVHKEVWQAVQGVLR